MRTFPLKGSLNEIPLHEKEKKTKIASDFRRLFAVKHIGQSSFYRAYVTEPATGILRR